MKLLTQAILDKFRHYSHTNANSSDPLVICKFFDPYGRYTYYATEFFTEDETFFGYCLSPLGSDCDEWGYTALSELESLGIRIERDKFFTPKPFSQVKGG